MKTNQNDQNSEILKLAKGWLSQRATTLKGVVSLAKRFVEITSKFPTFRAVLRKLDPAITDEYLFFMEEVGLGHIPEQDILNPGKFTGGLSHLSFDRQRAIYGKPVPVVVRSNGSYKTVLKKPEDMTLREQSLAFKGGQPVDPVEQRAKLDPIRARPAKLWEFDNRTGRVLIRSGSTIALTEECVDDMKAAFQRWRLEKMEKLQEAIKKNQVRAAA